MTAEELEKVQQNVETAHERAIKDSLMVKKREAKARKLAAGGPGSDKDKEDDADLEMLESEEEYSGSGEDYEEEDNEGVDGEASEAGSEESEDEEDGDEEMQDVPPMDSRSPAFSLSSVNRERSSVTPTPRLSDMPLAFVDDDDCDDDDDDDGGFAPFKLKSSLKKPPVANKKDPTVIPATPDRPNIPNIFKNSAQSPEGMSMTQLFAGTMPGSGGFGTMDQDLGKKVDGMRKLSDELMPNSQAPVYIDGLDGSQVPNTQLGRLDLDYSQGQIDNQDSLPGLSLDYTQSQVEDLESAHAQQMPDPTQDTGFGSYPQTAPPRFEASPEPTQEASGTEPDFGTIPTQILDKVDLMTQKPARGRLTRRVADFSDEEKESDADDDEVDAFQVLKKAAAAKKRSKATSKPFDKKKSEARDMIHEQASESEDEYGGGGGGGHSDEEEDDAAADEEMRDLLDDSEQSIDEGELAAFNNARERAQDLKTTNKLLRDIENGMMRKKRGAEFGLDDESDDEYVAQERRRRAKRRQMAQIRRALVQDGNLGKIADDPKKAAFFKVLQGASDSEDDFLDKPEEDLFAYLEGSQSQQVLPQKEEEEHADAVLDDGAEETVPAVDKQPPPLVKNSRRTFRTTKPSLLEIREASSHPLRILHLY